MQMKLVESLLVSLANNCLEKSWKTKICYNGDKMFSHFLIGFHTRYERIVSYPLPIDYWDLVNSTEIDKEPYNTFRKDKNTDTILKI
jgi:hypothetical protein